MPWCLACGGGEAGPRALVEQVRVEVIEGCAGGGVVLRSGLDLDGDGVLTDGADEVTSSHICDGAAGAAGQRGGDGADGAAGPRGASGPASLLRVEREPAGEHCAAGGTAVHHGVDGEGDGVLTAGEESDGSPAYLCDGAAGAGVVEACAPAGPGHDGRLKQLDTDWSVRRSTRILDLPGVGLCVPDLVFSHPARGRVYLEAMGFWSRDAVWKRVDLVEGGLAERVLFCVSRRLRVSEAALDGAERGALYVYKGAMNARSVLERVEALGAGVAGG